MKIIWIIISLLGAAAFSAIAMHRGETISSLWFIIASVCIYLVGYRFYSAWIAAKVLSIDASRATPAERFNDGRDYVPTNKWVVFGHHFAAIAGPGPLIGPTLAAQFGYLPGTLWILLGSVIGGCVQDMIIMFLSTRRNGKSLGQMAKDELGQIGGIAALIGTLMIVVILISVLGLIVVKAMKHSPWATSTVGATIPIAMFIGIYMRYIRPGKVLEASLIGIGMILLAVASGQMINSSPLLSAWFNYDEPALAWMVIVYGFTAAVMPVWLLLAPRDYLSTFLKLGTIFLLAIAIIILQPEIRMPALTKFIDGTGPIFGGKIFPFVFITIACGAISGFHSLVSSGTTPKLIANERDIRMIGYGSMLLESFVAIMAMIAACVLQPGVYFAINSPAGAVGETMQQAISTINSWGFVVTAQDMNELAHQMGETTLLGRTGGAPSLAVGMASIFGKAFGDGMLAIWYHFAIMFEAVFILTTLDAGTRVARFMLQDLLGNIWKPLGRTSWYPSNVLASFTIVASWGYFLYMGVIDPNGGVKILWPLFGIANQMLAGIALCVASAILIKSGRIKRSLVTVIPLLWVLIITSSAAIEKVTSHNPAIGYLAAAEQLKAKLATTANPALTERLITNQYIVTFLTIFFLSVLWVVAINTLDLFIKKMRGLELPPSSESPYERTALQEYIPIELAKEIDNEWKDIKRCC